MCVQHILWTHTHTRTRTKVDWRCEKPASQTGDMSRSVVKSFFSRSSCTWGCQLTAFLNSCPQAVLEPARGAHDVICPDLRVCVCVFEATLNKDPHDMYIKCQSDKSVCLGFFSTKAHRFIKLFKGEGGGRYWKWMDGWVGYAVLWKAWNFLWCVMVDQSNWTRSAVGLGPELSWRGSVLAPRPSGLGSCPSHETQRLRQHRAHAHLHS